MTSDEDKMLALNTVTGRVHDYEGTAPGGINSDDHNLGIGVIPCDCEGEDGELFVEAVEKDNLKMIKRRHLEVGIFEPAPCLEVADDE